MSKGAPAPPNYKPVIDAASKQASVQNNIAQRQLQLARQAYAHDRKVTDKVTSGLTDSMNFQLQNAKEDRARYESDFVPQEKALVDDANSYASGDRKAYEVGKATADVASQFDAARSSAQQDLESYGLNPAATRYGALDIGLRTQEAAAKAAAGTAANDKVDATARDLRAQAINLGRGLPAQSAQESAGGAGAGAAAVSGTDQTTATGFGAMGSAPQYTGAANQALDIWGNTMNTSYKNQLDAYNANQNSSSGFGSILGLVGGMGAKMFGFAEGGEVSPAMSPSKGKAIDDVLAKLTAGEFVVPADAARWLGEEKLHKIVAKAREARQGGGAIPAGAMKRQGGQAALPLG